LALSPALAHAAPGAGSNLNPPPVDQALGREILKEFIETDTQHSKGSTGLATSIAARLKAAGFADADIHLLAPADHPTKGNVVVRLRGTTKQPALLYMGHLDVVNARREDWTSDPFKLVERDGYFYGRGTLDMKGQDAAVLEALLRLKREGFKPVRDIIVAFTADEEAEGDANGVEWLLKSHRDLVDAGLMINTDSGEAGMDHDRKLFFGVQTSEKVYVTYELEVTDKGGHSSRPTPANPIFRLSRALSRLGDYQFPMHLTDTMKLYFAARAKLETGQTRDDMLSMATGAPDPKAVERLSAVVESNILFRTTCTATQIMGGHAESALPQRVRATIQCRVIPGEPLDGVKAQLATVLADPSIQIKVTYPGDNSPESPPNAKLFKIIEGVSRGMWPEAGLMPFMSPGASDSAFTRMAGIPSYGVDALWHNLDDDRSHGQDERIGVQVYDQEVEFTYRLMKTLASEKSLPLGK
jgi:acetylornithine deacetylase/succinyl-diaminopimelate desuccinylase-like protein